MKDRVCRTFRCRNATHAYMATYCRTCIDEHVRSREALARKKFNRDNPDRWAIMRLRDYTVLTDRMFDRVESYTDRLGVISVLDTLTRYRYRGWWSAFRRREFQDTVRVPTRVWDNFVALEQGKVAQGAEQNSAGVDSNEQENGQTHSGRGATLLPSANTDG